MIVVDTNVMVRMVVGGPNSVEAAALRDHDSTWVAPSIVMSELRNALLGYIRQGVIALDRAVEMSRDALRILGNNIIAVESAHVLDVAIECGLSAYDAEFVALARTLGVPLVTLDGEILEGATDVALRPRAFLDAT